MIIQRQIGTHFRAEMTLTTSLKTIKTLLIQEIAHRCASPVESTSEETAKLIAVRVRAQQIGCQVVDQGLSIQSTKLLINNAPKIDKAANPTFKI